MKYILKNFFNHHTRQLGLTLFASAFSLLAFSQNKSAEINKLINQLSSRGQFNGEILVSEHQTIIYKNGFGKADRKRDIKFSSNTPCYIASLSKQFTAMAIMILKERHQLSYDDLVITYLPNCPNYASKVTIRNLLNHTSGIADYVSLGYEHAGLTNQEIIKKLSRLDSLEFNPGDKFEYSNSNYVILAAIIEKVSGQTYKHFIEKEIFRPLGMKNSFVYDGTTALAGPVAHGYDRFGNDDDYNLLTVGEGGIYSTVEDFFKWDIALNTEKLATAANIKEAFSPAKLNNGTASAYGFGWGIGASNGEPIVSHAGRYGGFNTYVKRFLKSHNAIIFFTNSDFKNMGAIGNAIINILYDKPYELPKLSIADALFKTYGLSGIDSCMKQYKTLKKTGMEEFDFSESELNELGYQLMKVQKPGDAVIILKLNTEAYPSSANAYESLGEAYLNEGNKELAIKNLQKCLDLDPHNSDALGVLKRIGGQN